MNTYVCKQRRNRPRVTERLCRHYINRGERVCLKNENVRGIRQLKCEKAWEILNGK